MQIYSLNYQAIKRPMVLENLAFASLKERANSLKKHAKLNVPLNFDVPANSNSSGITGQVILASNGEIKVNYKFNNAPVGDSCTVAGEEAIVYGVNSRNRSSFCGLVAVVLERALIANKLPIGAPYIPKK